ncbi:hypothetical protein J6590_025619 [Homalodisca vitripennis]|nr:hypothetical protein J6590_025619 [Homalodisca vitripennis]
MCTAAKVPLSFARCNHKADYAPLNPEKKALLEPPTGCFRSQKYSAVNTLSSCLADAAVLPFSLDCCRGKHFAEMSDFRSHSDAPDMTPKADLPLPTTSSRLPPAIPRLTVPTADRRL